MQIPFGRISAAILAVSGIVLAQETPPQQPETAPSPASAGSLETAAKSTGNTSDTSAALDYLMNRKPQDGSAGKHALDAGKRAETKAIAEDAIGIPYFGDPETRAPV